MTTKLSYNPCGECAKQFAYCTDVPIESRDPNLLNHKEQFVHMQKLPVFFFMVEELPTNTVEQKVVACRKYAGNYIAMMNTLDRYTNPTVKKTVSSMSVMREHYKTSNQNIYRALIDDGAEIVSSTKGRYHTQKRIRINGQCYNVDRLDDETATGSATSSEQTIPHFPMDFDSDPDSDPDLEFD